ncbi:tetratricopeptide repeat protein [Kangiella marina]|uniref:Tetratricopeptide repeat protein n=1 Tax=Kangiella marina TaxID=1079178 RepID=A0ABP8ICP1_9GAMM
MLKRSAALLTLPILLLCKSLYAESANTFLSNCKEAVTSQDNSQAIEVCERQLSSAADTQSVAEATMIRLELADLYALQEDREQSRHLLQQVKASESFVLNQNIRYRWNRAIGMDYLHQTQYTEATEYLQQAYDIAQLANDNTLLAKSANDLGLIYYKQKNYKQALLHYKQSLKLKETLGNRYYIGTTLNNLGLLNKELKNYSEAIDYYQQALEQFLTYTEIDNFDQRVFTNISHLYEDLAVTYSLSGDIKQGEKYTRRVIDTFSRKLGENNKVRAMKNLALIHLELQQPQKAQLFIQEAVHYAASDSKYLAELDYIKAHIAFLNNKYEEAKQLINQSIPLSMAQSDSVILEKSFYLLHQINVQQENVNQALDSLKQSYHYKEQSLKAQYESDLRVIQEQIEKERVERRLIAEQLKSQQQNNRIQSLSNTILVISLVLVIIAFCATFIIYRKVKEKQRLVESIKSHKEKLLLLESEQDGDSTQDDSSSEGEYYDFRQQLVDLLVETLSLWEKATRTDRIELAEKSGIWKVSIDDGRLRTRSLDKYIDINKIPRNPRWRNVVKTSHYVLAECPLENQERSKLESKLDKVMTVVKQRSVSQSS